jgi:large repetitive protein
VADKQTIKLASRLVKSWQKIAAFALWVPLLTAGLVAVASAADLTNSARARATAPGGTTDAVVSTISTVNVPVIAKTPRYSVVKSIVSTTTSNGGSASQVDGGDIITYQYVVTNTGNVTLDPPTVTDPGVRFNGGAAQALTVPVAYVSGDLAPVGKLNVGEAWTYTASYTLTQANVNTAAGITNGVTNTVSVSALDQQGVSIAPNPGTSTLTATTTINSVATMTIAKTSNTAGPLVAGQVVVFSYLVTNTGNVTLTGVNVAETAFNGTGGTAALVPAGGASVLAPGASTTFTASYTVTQADVDNLQP